MTTDARAAQPTPVPLHIRHRYTDAVLREVPDGTLVNANLREANLSDADLRGADLRGADLRGANLSDADLRGADLRGANLRGADLRGANLRGANLSDADLSDADLSDADLSWAKNAPLIVYGLHWRVIISGVGTMRIGCQHHSVTSWASFADAEIAAMDSTNALSFWKQHREMLLALCASYVHPVNDSH